MKDLTVRYFLIISENMYYVKVIIKYYSLLMSSSIAVNLIRLQLA